MSTEAETEQQEAKEYVRAPSVRSIVDIATLFGIIGAFALIVTAIVLGGSPYAFIDLPSICIVIGGTFGITVACYSFRDVGTAFLHGEQRAVGVRYPVAGDDLLQFGLQEAVLHPHRGAHRRDPVGGGRVHRGPGAPRRSPRHSPRAPRAPSAVASTLPGAP